MDQIILWMSKNKEWFFSGAGIFLLTLMLGAMRYLLRKDQLGKAGIKKQTQKSGKHSVSIQSGRDTKIDVNKDQGK